MFLILFNIFYTTLKKHYLIYRIYAFISIERLLLYIKFVRRPHTRLVIHAYDKIMNHKGHVALCGSF